MDICRVLTGDIVMAYKVRVADSFITRFIGLLRDKGLNDDEGLLITKCRQVHTIGMKFNIDVIFLSCEDKIIHIESKMKPYKISKYVKDACKVLELKEGAAEKYGLKPQYILKIEC